MPKNNPIEVVELGHLLRVDVHPRGDAYAMEWSRKDAPALLWCPSFKCLYFSTVKGARKRSSSASTVQIRCYEKWHDNDPTGARIDVFDVSGDWQKVGEVRRVDYHSTKWNDDVEYTHSSRGGSYLYRMGPNEHTLYAIQGNMRATERGLIK